MKQFLLGIKFILKMSGSQNRGAKTYQEDDDETLVISIACMSRMNCAPLVFIILIISAAHWKLFI